MKKIVTILLLSLCFSMVYAQRDYRSECRKETGGLYGVDEGFKVSYYSDLYGVRFKSGNQCLTPELEEQIRDFLRKPYNGSNHFKRGKNVMHIIKRDGKFFVYISGARPPLKEL